MDLLSIEFGGWVDESDCDDEGYRKGASKYTRKKLVKHIFTEYRYED